MADGELTQEEISALLASYSVEAEEVAPPAPTASAPPARPLIGSKRVKVYDFMRPDKFSREQLRTMQLVHEIFARHLAFALSAQVRSPVRIDVASCTQCVYEEFVDSLTPPTSLYVFSAPPLEGRMIMEMSVNLSLTIVNRLLGGPWRTSFRSRDLTEIEYSLMKGVVARALEGFRVAWATIVDVKPELVGYESDAQFAQVLAPNDPVCLLSFAVHLGGFAYEMSLCIAYTALQHVLAKLNPQQWLTYAQGVNARRQGSARIGLDDAVLGLTVELGQASATMKELIELEVGDVIRLNSKRDEPLQICVGDLIKFTGMPGTIGSKSAVKIVEVLPVPLGRQEYDG